MRYRAEAIESTTGVSTSIKWPNDLFLGDRKVGGFLMEIAGEQDTVDWVIAGIGINVNTDVRELPATLSRSAGSLKFGERKGGRPKRTVRANAAAPGRGVHHGSVIRILSCS